MQMVHQPQETRRAASRIAGLATNVLASGLILILGVAGGQQALRWWSAVRPTSATDSWSQAMGSPVIGPASAERPRPTAGRTPSARRHHLTFGDDALLATRTELHGSVPQVLTQLRDDCRSIAQRIERVRRSPGPAERHLLARIRHQKPVESTKRWRMYQIETPVPMVVTVLDQPAPLAADEVPRRDIAPPESRVVSWGLALPAVADVAAASDRWTLFTLTAETPRPGSFALQRVLPVPPQCQRTMSLQSEAGALMVGFRGTGRLLAWRTYYDAQLAGPEWTPTSGWRHDGPIWQRSFVSQRDGRLDVQLIDEADGLLSGLLMSAPPQGVAREK